MATVTVAELRQDPTKAINAATDGISTDITKHGRVVARLVPPAGDPWRRFGEVRHLFQAPDPVWAAEIEAERDRDRIDPDV